MNDEHAFLDGIFKEDAELFDGISWMPGREQPVFYSKLVFADWLEERGRGEEAVVWRWLASRAMAPYKLKYAPLPSWCWHEQLEKHWHRGHVVCSDVERELAKDGSCHGLHEYETPLAAYRDIVRVLLKIGCPKQKEAVVA